MTVQQCQEPPAEVELPALAIEVAGKTFIAAPEQGPVVIGRALPAQIRITTHAISRTHLRIEPVGQQWVVSDAGTRNGTFCDGERIDAVPLPAPLTESVTFHMGGVDGIAVRIRSATADTDTPTGAVVPLAAADLDDGDIADSADSLTGRSTCRSRGRERRWRLGAKSWDCPSANSPRSTSSARACWCGSSAGSTGRGRTR